MKTLFKNSVIVILLSGTAIYLPSCKKEATLPVVTTTTVSNVTQTSALAGGAVTDNGGADVTEFGVCWSTTPNPTIGGNKITIGVSPGSFTVSLSGLTVNTKYYVRAYATNSAGTNYGNEVTFTTTDIAKTVTVPILTTTSVTSITSTTAVSGGTITDDGGGIVTSKGICWSLSENPTIENSIANYFTYEYSFSLNLSQLTPNTNYFVRAFATNSVGTAYGNQVSFITRQNATLTTTEVTSITATNAISGGTIINDGGEEIISRGVYWGTNPDMNVIVGATVDGNGSGSFVSYLYGLTPKTTYYVKAYVLTDAGKAFGPTISFTTPEISPIIFNPDLTYGKVSDIDGNEYKTIQIGTQEWMAENLKTTKYNDGNSLPNVTDFTEWTDLNTAAYCWYKNDASAYKATYGALYNWFTVNTGKLCPAGWHVPSDTEWTTLLRVLGWCRCCWRQAERNWHYSLDKPKYRGNKFIWFYSPSGRNTFPI